MKYDIMIDSKDLHIGFFFPIAIKNASPAPMDLSYPRATKGKKPITIKGLYRFLFLSSQLFQKGDVM